MALNSFAEVQAFITQVMEANNEDGGFAGIPHKGVLVNLNLRPIYNWHVPGVSES